MCANLDVEALRGVAIFEGVEIPQLSWAHLWQTRPRGQCAGSEKQQNPGLVYTFQTSELLLR